MNIVTVHMGKPYNVRIGHGLLAQAGAWLTGLVAPHAAALIADDTVDALYGDVVAASLTAAGYRVERMRFPHGESSKNLATYGEALSFLARTQLTRSDVVVALGGGVTGDLAGFAAATYLRGVRVAQIPTTLLAMVDSSVGGKTGIDLPAGKNLAGAFHQPIGVLCDPDTLHTLPPDTLADGVAEALKYGVLCDEALFDLLSGGSPLPSIEEIIARCVTIKAGFCAQDERDQGKRQLLNLGHTLGHAIERLSEYAIAHGHAVAVGMVYATRIAAGLGLCDAQCEERLKQALVRNGLPVSSGFSAESLADAALGDKKRAGDTLTLVLPRKIGQCELHPVPVGRLAELTAMAVRNG